MATDGKGKRRKHSAQFKAKVGLEALRGVKTVSEIAKAYDVHPVQVSEWKKQALRSLPEAFEKSPNYDAAAAEKREQALHAKIGQLTVEVDFLKKACRQLGIPLDVER